MSGNNPELASSQPFSARMSSSGSNTNTEFRPNFTSPYGYAAQLAKVIRYENGISNIFEADEGLCIEYPDGSTQIISVGSGIEDVIYDENYYLHFLDKNGADLFDPIRIVGGSGGGGGSSGNNAEFSATNTSGWLSKTIASGSECEISFEWSSVENGQSTGDGSMIMTVNGISRINKNVVQGHVTLEIGEFLNPGKNSVKVSLTDVYGNGKTLGFTVNVVELTISSTFDSTVPATDGFTFTYVPVGMLMKTVYFFMDGQNIGVSVTSLSAQQMSFNVPMQDHGTHVFEVFFVSTVDGNQVESNHLRYEIMFVAEHGNDPIIATSFNKSTVSQYDTVIIPFTVYNPLSLTTSITITLNGDIVSEQTVGRTERSYSFRANTVGENTVVITAGTVAKTITFNVTKTEIDVEAETDALALYLTSSGRSNNEAHPEQWSYGNINAALTGFNFATNGWVQDSDGITVLRINGGARVNIPYRIFSNDFRATGKTIEVEFATRDILNYDASIISCFSGGRGLNVTTQKCTLASEQSSIFTQYKEDEHVRISFVISKRGDTRLISCFINGIWSGVTRYPSNDDFSQMSPVGITIGSNECTTDIYNIRVYDKDLTRKQVVDNWIADSQTITTMINKYTRNNIYNEYGEITIGKLPSDLPYMILEAEELPQYKGDKKTISGSYTDPSSPSKSFTFTNCQIDVQGTSSQYYPRKNYKMKFRDGFNMSGGTNVKKYAMRPDSIPVSTFCMKADVASSEGANNVELVRLYDNICPYKTPAQLSNNRVRQGIDGFPIVIFWYNPATDDIDFLGKYNFNNDKSNEEVFGFEEGDESWEVKNNTSNRVLWKSADYSGRAWLDDFEARYPDIEPVYEDPTQLAEFAAWIVSTDTTAATNNALLEPVTYPSTVIENVQHEDPVTGDITYEEVETVVNVTYTNDTAEYRLAKFKNEVGNYIEVDSMLFYYLFTEIFLMVDSRAKNMFPSFMGSEFNGEEGQPDE